MTLPTALEYAMEKAGTFRRFVEAQDQAARTIRLTAEEIRSCFDRVIGPICERIDSITIRNADGSSRGTRKFLTGGLTGNVYVLNKMKDRYPSTLYDAQYTRNLAVGTCRVILFHPYAILMSSSV